MTDDIVTRLRIMLQSHWINEELLLHEIETIKKAADEIERLRTERDIWRDSASQVMKMYQQQRNF